jgi:hypothetical protein
MAKETWILSGVTNAFEEGWHNQNQKFVFPIQGLKFADSSGCAV